MSLESNKYKAAGLSRMKKLMKAVMIFLASFLLLPAFLSLIISIAKYYIYPDYYSMKTDVCKNPGLWNDFVCQDICNYEEGNKFFICGYMADNTASRIYVTDINNDSYYVSLSLDGQQFKGHSGGIACHEDEIYVVCNNSIHIIPLQNLLEAENGDTVEITDVIKIDNGASSAATYGNHLYVGEFCNDKNHVANHPFETPDGQYHAIIGRYSFDDLSKPDKIYSIREKVQGICFVPNGKVVLTTSYGLSDSYLYIYEERNAIYSGLEHEGAPVYFLCEPEKVIKGPAMIEGIDYYDGQIITLSEIASNKYIVGKFMFSDKIVALDIFK